MSNTNEPAPTAETPRRVQRRSREELESLAKDLAGDSEAAPATGMSMTSLAIIAVGLFAGLAWLLAPREPVKDRAATIPPAIAQLQQKLEADRERARKQQGGGGYLERSAAADAAALKDLAASARRLAQAVEAPPPPQPKAAARAGHDEASAPKTETPSATSESLPKSEPAPIQAPRKSRAAAAAPGDETNPPAANASASPSSPATETASAQCRLHVSQLSSNGKLTYDDVLRMNGARVRKSTGHVVTPPIDVNGRPVAFDIAPNGCVTVERNSPGR